MLEAPNVRAKSATAEEHRLIAAGFGGQGILTFGKLLCHAAMSEGRTVTYLPVYGSEVRGGTANCQLVVSTGEIYSPLVEEADSLAMFNQLSCERFGSLLKPGGLMLVNSTSVDMREWSPPEGARPLVVPAGEVAADMGDVRAANIIMLGAYAEAAGLVAFESCREALSELFRGRKADLLALNLRALDAGRAMAREGGP